MSAKRLLIYIGALAGVMVGLAAIERYTEDGLRLLVSSPIARTLGTSEYSVVEWLQVLALVVIAALSWRAMRLSRTQRPLAAMGMAVAAAAFCRELDFFFDAYLFDHAWQVLVAIIAVVAIVFAVRHRRALTASWVRAVQQPPMVLMVLGVSLLLVFAPVLGSEGLWQSLMGGDYVRVAKIAAEELAELAGYWLWLIGQIEFTLSCRRQHAMDAPERERRRGERRRRKRK